MPSELKENVFNNWVDKNIIVDIQGLASLNLLYEHYATFSKEKHKSIPYKPKFFSRMLRQHFIKGINEGSIEFTYKKVTIIMGIDLKNNTSTL